MDPPHRFWNSEKLGLLQGDAFEAVLLSGILFNVGNGPYNTHAWQAQLSEALAEYVALNSPGTCPLLAAFLPLIARDMPAT
eukprot:1964945-Lingulodinium_polyedra.AAC.1